MDAAEIFLKEVVELRKQARFYMITAGIHSNMFDPVSGIIPVGSDEEIGNKLSPTDLAEALSAIQRMNQAYQRLINRVETYEALYGDIFDTLPPTGARVVESYVREANRCQVDL